MYLGGELQQPALRLSQSLGYSGSRLSSKVHVGFQYSLGTDEVAGTMSPG